jgi:hypothetical protein
LSIFIFFPSPYVAFPTHTNLTFMCIIIVPEVSQEWRWQSQSSRKECEQMELPHHQAQVVQIPHCGKQLVHKHIPSILCVISLILHILCLLKGVMLCLFNNIF